MKKILTFILAALMCSTILVGCNNTTKVDKDIDKEQISEEKIEETIKDNEETTNTQNSEENLKENKDEEKKPEKTEEEIAAEKEAAKKQQEEDCKKALESIKFNVLSTSVVDYEDAMINGYGTYSEDYDKATIFTIGVEFPDGVYSNYWSYMKIAGETATGADGNYAAQSASSVGWVTDDSNYAILIHRVGGEVDASKVTLKLTGEVKGVEVDSKFENNGEEIGFEQAKEKFSKDNIFGTGSYIVKLQGRHYFIVRLYTSSTSWGEDSLGYRSSRKDSFVLIPIEDGFGESLKKDEIKLVINEEVENTTANLLVNESGRIDASSIETQSTIEVEVRRTIVESRNENNTYDDEVYDKIEDDEKQMLKNVQVEIDDGDGNTVVLKFAD